MNEFGIRPINFYRKWSLSCHFVLIALAVALSYVTWLEGKKQQEVNIKLVQSSVRVDVVAMPEKTIKELKALESKSVAAPKPKKEPAPKKVVKETPDTGREFKKASNKKSFSDLMKQYSKEPVEKAKKVKKKKEDSFDKETLKRFDGLIKRGNKINKGQALVGDKVSAEVLSALQEYASGLPAQVKPFWKLPSYLMDKGLQCRIQVFINARGELLKANLYESSGDSEYDNKALSAVKKASPFSPPESDIVDRLVKGEVLLGFPL